MPLRLTVVHGCALKALSPIGRSNNRVARLQQKWLPNPTKLYNAFAAHRCARPRLEGALPDRQKQQSCEQRTNHRVQCFMGILEFPAHYEAATSSVSSTAPPFSSSTLFRSTGKLHSKPEYTQKQINQGMQTMRPM